MSVAAHHEALVREGSALRLTRVPTAPPGRGGVLVAMSFVGVCGTDLQILNGSRPDSASILGHEGSGVIVQAGLDALLRVGQPVVFDPGAQLPSGRILGHNFDGLYQEYYCVDVSLLEQGILLAVPDGLPLVLAALAEPLSAVVYAYELCTKVTDLDTVVIFGAGPVGLLATAFFSAQGVSVTLIHPNRRRLDSAAALNLPRAPILLQTCEVNHFDAGLICTTRAGAPSALASALQVVKNGGCIDLITNYPEHEAAPGGMNCGSLRAVRAANLCGNPVEGKYLNAVVSDRSHSITGHRGTSHSHLRKAMSELQAHQSTYAQLITHILPAAEAGVAIQTLAHSPERTLGGRDCIKVVIDFTRSRRAH